MKTEQWINIEQLMKNYLWIKVEQWMKVDQCMEVVAWNKSWIVN